jgi:hypothetical protein
LRRWENPPQYSTQKGFKGEMLKRSRNKFRTKGSPELKVYQHDKRKR